MNEKLRLAVELRKKGLSLKKIEQQTGINFRDLSVLFKYLKLDEGLGLKEERKVFESKINFLKEENEKLKELLEEEEKEKKDLAHQIAVNRYSIKILKPSLFLLSIFLFFLIGAGLGISISSKNYISTFLNQVYNLDEKNKKVLELKDKLIEEYKNKEIKIKNEYQKKLNKVAQLNNFLKMYSINYKIQGNLVEFKSSNDFEIRYFDNNDNPIVTDVTKLIIATDE